MSLPEIAASQDDRFNFILKSTSAASDAYSIETKASCNKLAYSSKHDVVFWACSKQNQAGVRAAYGQALISGDNPDKCGTFTPIDVTIRAISVSACQEVAIIATDKGLYKVHVAAAEQDKVGVKSVREVGLITDESHGTVMRIVVVMVFFKESVCILWDGSLVLRGSCAIIFLLPPPPLFSSSHPPPPPSPSS